MVFAGALALCGCATAPGEPASGFLAPQIADAYIPLRATRFLDKHFGAGVVIAPGVAVTNAHNANLVDPASVIGTARGYDLLFFHTAKSATAATATPRTGEAVIAYGQGANGLRQSLGVAVKFWPAAFGFESDAGPGFSGGPVVDAKTGALLGITYGFLDQGGKRLMLAYNISFVMEEWAKIQAAKTSL
jgi:hypothetical protein